MRPRRPAADLPSVRLRRDVVRAVRAGHPWVYAEALAAPRGLAAGAVVDLLDPAGRFLARGGWDPDSPSAFRGLTLDPAEPVAAGLVAERIAAAAARRAELLAAAGGEWQAVIAERLDALHCEIDSSAAQRALSAAPLAETPYALLHRCRVPTGRQYRPDLYVNVAAAVCSAARAGAGSHA